MKIICSNSVLNVLGRLFLEATAMRGTTPKEYNKCVSAIKSLNTSILTVYANKPLSWARINATIICPNRYWFKYRRFENAIFVDEVYDTTRGKIIVESVHITQSQLCRIVESAVREVLNKQMLNEIYFHKSGVEKRIGEYEVVDGNLWDGKVDGIRDMGWVQDVRLYSSDKPNGRTYALYKRCDNGKFFFVEVVDDESNPKKSKAVRIKSTNVPEPIVSDALSLVHRDRKGLNLFS